MNKISQLKSSKLEKKIKITFKNKNLLREALTHRSYINELKDEEWQNNERLEFLGDAVLELVVTEFLYNEFQTTAEGELTSYRAALVKTTSLAEEAKKMDLGNYLYMSYGEESTGGRDREYILANAMEALIGAIYTEFGYKKTKEFIVKNICYKIETIIKKQLYIDSKSKLQAVAQDVLKFTPRYELINEEGPDHNKIFEMAVIVEDKIFGTGSGKSKQEAEQNAAEKALENWEQNISKLTNS